jgi:hypothetical protein
VAKESSDAYRRYRGFVAVDNVALKTGMGCKGHCTFEGGFCGWTNDEDDDFDWFLVRCNSETSYKISCTVRTKSRMFCIVFCIYFVCENLTECTVIDLTIIH